MRFSKENCFTIENILMIPLCNIYKKRLIKEYESFMSLFGFEYWSQSCSIFLKNLIS